MTRVCSDCNLSKEKDEYSGRQWRKLDGSARCEDCVEGYSDGESGSPTERENEDSTPFFKYVDPFPLLNIGCVLALLGCLTV